MSTAANYCTTETPEPAILRQSAQSFKTDQRRCQMNKQCDVAVIVGSLRKDSINRKVANALAEAAPVALKLSIIEIGHLPIYNQDGDENPPAAWTQFRERIRAADAVLFVTPEHNRSVTAALKNAIVSAQGRMAIVPGAANLALWSARRR